MLAVIQAWGAAEGPGSSSGQPLALSGNDGSISSYVLVEGVSFLWSQILFLSELGGILPECPSRFL